MPTPIIPPKPMKKGFLVLGAIGLILIVGILALIFSSGRALINKRNTLTVGQSGSAVMPETMGGSGGEFLAYDQGYESAPSRGIAQKMMQPISPMPSPGATPADRERVGPKVIRNGSLTLRVDDVDSSTEQLKALATSVNGFVAASNVSEYNGQKTGTITLRVPSEKFDETVSAAKRLSLVVLNESTNADDVTDQYVDLEARLKAAKAEEAQYLEILKQARTIEDTLNVTARLSEVRSRIEQLQGQLRYLSDRTDYATLTVTLTQSARVEVPTKTWRPFETVKQAARTLVIALQSLVDILITGIIFLAGFLLPILILVLVVFWILRAIWRKFSRRG